MTPAKELLKISIVSMMTISAMLMIGLAVTTETGWFVGYLLSGFGMMFSAVVQITMLVRAIVRDETGKK